MDCISRERLLTREEAARFCGTTVEFLMNCARRRKNGPTLLPLQQFQARNMCLIRLCSRLGTPNWAGTSARRDRQI